MVRRYQDAIRTLSNILLFIQRTKQHFQSRTYLYDQVGMLHDAVDMCSVIFLPSLAVSPSVRDCVLKVCERDVLQTTCRNFTKYTTLLQFGEWWTD